MFVARMDATNVFQVEFHTLQKTMMLEMRAGHYLMNLFFVFLSLARGSAPSIGTLPSAAPDSHTLAVDAAPDLDAAEEDQGRGSGGPRPIFRS